MRFGGALLAGARLRPQPEDGHVALVSAHERVDVHPVAPARDRPAGAPAQACSRPARARGGRRRSSSSCGHAESSFHVLLGAAAFLVLRLWQARRAAAPASGVARPRAGLRWRDRGRGGARRREPDPVRRAAPRTRPTSSTGAGHSVDLHFPAKDVLGLFLPDYWGRPTQTPIRPLLLERAIYVGALPLMLAAAALILRPTVERVGGRAVRRALAGRAVRGAAVHCRS